MPTSKDLKKLKQKIKTLEVIYDLAHFPYKKIIGEYVDELKLKLKRMKGEK